jgi:hypothetical protein
MNYSYEVTTPPNTPIDGAIITDIKLTKGLVDYVTMFFPFGCASLVGIQIWIFGYQLFPTNRNAWYKGDNILIAFNSDIDISQEPFMLYIHSYNLDELYSHTIYFNVNMTKGIVNTNVIKLINALRINV